MRRAVLLVLSLVIAGCAATGLRYLEDPAARAAIPSGMGQFVVFRTASSSQYLLRAASLSLDGKQVGSVPYESFLVVNVPPGQHTVRVELADAPGACDLTFETLPGVTNYFEVEPRRESFEAGLYGLLIPLVNPAAAIAASGVSLGGMAAESAGRVCGGAFSIALAQPVDASAKLAGLRNAR
jgi:hypothetical protein